MKLPPQLILTKYLYEKSKILTQPAVYQLGDTVIKLVDLEVGSIQGFKVLTSNILVPLNFREFNRAEQNLFSFVGHVVSLTGSGLSVNVRIQTQDLCRPDNLAISIPKEQAKHWMPGTVVQFKVYPVPERDNPS